uniref:U1-Hexatoxin-Hf1a_1 n=1 Tax=Hadronyche formidabilis TaxID=426499 RepID=A0A4Q8K3V8_HADFO
MDDRKCRGPVKKTPLPTVVLLISVAMATGQIVENDPDCLKVGGICAIATSCPQESVVVAENGTDLCGGRPAGAVCCDRLPNNVNNCREHGGRCGDGDACQNVQKFGQLDCEDGKQCCLLIY